MGVHHFFVILTQNRFVSSLFILREESPGNTEQFATWKGGYVLRNEVITDSVTENEVA